MRSLYAVLYSALLELPERPLSRLLATRRLITSWLCLYDAHYGWVPRHQSQALRLPNNCS